MLPSTILLTLSALPTVTKLPFTSRNSSTAPFSPSTPTSTSYYTTLPTTSTTSTTNSTDATSPAFILNFLLTLAYVQYAFYTDGLTQLYFPFSPLNSHLNLNLNLNSTDPNSTSTTTATTSATTTDSTADTNTKSSAGFSSPFYDTLVALREQEAQHIASLLDALDAGGMEATGPLRYSFPDFGADEEAFVKLAAEIEGVILSA
ncbi:hypothetical protein MMC21_001635 [Puttea exsequens]|nr:hypothetical protein [Puttea exsequens]